MYFRRFYSHAALLGRTFPFKGTAFTAFAFASTDSKWRNRDEFFEGRDAIRAFLTKKWQKELQYKLMKELWCYQGNRISVRFEYEYHDLDGQWWRAHGNEV